MIRLSNSGQLNFSKPGKQCECFSLARNKNNLLVSIANDSSPERV